MNNKAQQASSLAAVKSYQRDIEENCTALYVASPPLARTRDPTQLTQLVLDSPEQTGEGMR